MAGYESTVVKVEIAKRGWRQDELAHRSGITAGTLRRQLCDNIPSLSIGLRMEAGFEYQVRIRSTSSDLAARKFCVEHFGADPSLLNLAALRALATKISLPGHAAHRRRPELLRAVLIHLHHLTKKESAHETNRT